MEQENKQGVCEAQDSADKGMGSDFENSEDRERDPEESRMGSYPQDANKREGPPEQELDSNAHDEALGGDPEERELVSDICPGEEKLAFPWKLPPLTVIYSSSRVRTQRSILCGRAL